MFSKEDGMCETFLLRKVLSGTKLLMKLSEEYGEGIPKRLSFQHGDSFGHSPDFVLSWRLSTNLASALWSRKYTNANMKLLPTVGILWSSFPVDSAKLPNKKMNHF